MRPVKSIIVTLLHSPLIIIIIGSENMTSRVALWDWAAILQAYTKRCQRVQVNANSSSITTKDQYQSMKFCNLAFNRQYSYQSVSH